MHLNFSRLELRISILEFMQSLLEHDETAGLHLVSTSLCINPSLIYALLQVILISCEREAIDGLVHCGCGIKSSTTSNSFFLRNVMLIVDDYVMSC